MAATLNLLNFGWKGMRMNEDEICWDVEDFDLCNEVERAEYLKELESFEEWANDNEA